MLAGMVFDMWLLFFAPPSGGSIPFFILVSLAFWIPAESSDAERARRNIRFPQMRLQWIISTSVPWALGADNLCNQDSETRFCYVQSEICQSRTPCTTYNRAHLEDLTVPSSCSPEFSLSLWVHIGSVKTGRSDSCTLATRCHVEATVGNSKQKTSSPNGFMMGVVYIQKLFPTCNRACRFA